MQVDESDRFYFRNGQAAFEGVMGIFLIYKNSAYRRKLTEGVYQSTADKVWKQERGRKRREETLYASPK